MADPRLDFTRRENPPAFWEGFGAHRQGAWHDTNPYKNVTPEYSEWLVGWSFALTEGKFPKPWWKSKFIWTALAEAFLGGLLAFAPPEMVGGSSVPGFIMVLHSALIASLRTVTKGAVK